MSGGLLDGKTIRLVYGDYAKEMAAITGYIKKAAENAENETQEKMHTAYAKSFEEGSLLAFKDSQRHWIRDQGPMVECNIGFIETYRDPAGVRGEWEGFAAVVNLERTRAFGELVRNAPTLIPLLPWSKDCECPIPAPCLTLSSFAFCCGNPDIATSPDLEPLSWKRRTPTNIYHSREGQVPIPRLHLARGPDFLRIGNSRRHQYSKLR